MKQQGKLFPSSGAGKLWLLREAAGRGPGQDERGKALLLFSRVALVRGMGTAYLCFCNPPCSGIKDTKGNYLLKRNEVLAAGKFLHFQEWNFHLLTLQEHSHVPEKLFLLSAS